MLYAGLDLSRKRLDFHVLDGEGATVELGASPPDADGLQRLSERVARLGAPVRAAIESMNGARFVHDRSSSPGWQVEIADAQKVKGLAPLACKTDRIDAWVLAELARRDLVPAIWLPDPLVRAERERARWRLHLVRHHSSLKQRVHAVLLTHGKPCPRGVHKLDLPLQNADCASAAGVTRIRDGSRRKTERLTVATLWVCRARPFTSLTTKASDFRGFLEADDGTRTHDLLHGKGWQAFAPVRVSSPKP